MKIELITCEEGDWEVVRVDGVEVFANHRAEFDDWGKVLQKISNDSDFSSLDVEYKVIPDDDMEVGNY